MNILARLNEWMAKLATTNFKIVAAVGLAYGTMVFYFVSEIRCQWQAACRPLDSTNFGLWLAFVAGAWGFAYAQFAKKRDTYAAPSPDSERANVPSDPPPAAPAKPTEAVVVVDAEPRITVPRGIAPVHAEPND